MKPAIRVENLSKKYRLGSRSIGSYSTLRDKIADSAAGAWSGIRRCFGGPSTEKSPSNGSGETFWALRDVSFAVQPGEVVGIVGRNGAGKSTLLKILSRIVEPTAGRCEVRGRMASLLEVGTGFHPELTGRENIYLNGSLLGMTRKEMDCKFHEIVAFSEIEQFLDTPVKRYSSGMYVRLAFAVAAHMDPEILLIDEVLAVGDATYQKRCINRMNALAREGKTILFVSHNMDLIPRLCQKGVLLASGKVVKISSAEAIVKDYLDRNEGREGNGELANCSRAGDGRARFRRFWLEHADGTRSFSHRSGEDLTICMDIEAFEAVPDAALAVVLRTMTGVRLITSWTREAGFACSLESGVQVYRCRFPKLKVRPGHRLAVMLWMEAAGVMDSVEEAGVIDILDGPGSSDWSTDSSQGVILCDYTWIGAEKRMLSQSSSK